VAVQAPTRWLGSIPLVPAKAGTQL